jgi:hypothetical protein
MLEETLTDLNLLELKDRNPFEIYCRSFTKREEGLNGADWEWWLTNQDRTSWLGFRIQAKVLNLNADEFTHLHYKRGIAYQATRLKNAALRGGLVPLYCFYLHHPALMATHRPRGCGTFAPKAEHLGCSLSSVEHVERLRKAKKKDLGAVLSNAVPWHCLVCCAGFGGEDLPTRAWAYVRNRLGEPVRRRSGRVLADVQVPPGPREQPPQHVLATMEGLEAVNPPSDIRGVVVIVGSDDA